MATTTTAATNSRQWWDDYFLSRWEANRGSQQTRHFMERLVANLPEFERDFLQSNALEILDWGCAFGEGVEVLAATSPKSHVVGLDFAAVAIEKARSRQPDREFILTPDGDIPRPFDVIVTSNCLEHFEQPVEVMSRHLSACRTLYLALVPYNEHPLCEYHCSQFREESFPEQVNGFVRLYLSSIEVDPLYWRGRQLLAVYGSANYAPERGMRATHETERQK